MPVFFQGQIPDDITKTPRIAWQEFSMGLLSSSQPRTAKHEFLVAATLL
jgi:hypothetical protein